MSNSIAWILATCFRFISRGKLQFVESRATDSSFLGSAEKAEAHK